MKLIRKVLFQITVITVFACSSVAACPNCRAAVKSNIYDARFMSNFVVMMLPLFVMGIVGVGLFHADKLKKEVRKFYGKK